DCLDRVDAFCILRGDKPRNSVSVANAMRQASRFLTVDAGRISKDVTAKSPPWRSGTRSASKASCKCRPKRLEYAREQEPGPFVRHCRMTTPQHFIESFLREKASAYAEANAHLVPLHAKYFGEPLSNHATRFLMRDPAKAVFEDVKESAGSATV